MIEIVKEFLSDWLPIHSSAEPLKSNKFLDILFSHKVQLFEVHSSTICFFAQSQSTFITQDRDFNHLNVMHTLRDLLGAWVYVWHSFSLLLLSL